MAPRQRHGPSWQLSLLLGVHCSFLRCAHRTATQTAGYQAKARAPADTPDDEVMQKRLEDHVLQTTTVYTHSQPGGRNLTAMKLWNFSSHMSGMDLLGGDHNSPECV